MASVVISGDSSGTITLSAPSVAGSNTATLPAQTGTLQMLGQGTAVATTSGTSIDFTSIPSWVKRITVILDGVSTNGTSFFLFQVGSSSISTSGYTGIGGRYNNANQTTIAPSTAGLYFAGPNAAADTATGHIVATLVTGNTWVITSVVGFSNSSFMNTNATRIALGGTLDRVRFTTTNGTDTFDAGSVNILYEG
jgi:hypothetical protein